MKVFDSAKQKHMNLTKQLNDGDFTNPDILLAIAERHETDAIVKYGLQQIELIFDDYNNLSNQVMGSLQKFQLDDVNNVAQELILSESAQAVTVPKTIKKRHTSVHSPRAKEVNPDIANKPEKTEDKKVIQRRLSQNFHVELGKLADWLAHDIKTLNDSKSDEKRKLGKIIGEQLEEIYSQIDSTNWSTEKAEALTHKTKLEKRLLTLGQLIEDAMAQTSPEISPLSSPEFSQLSSLTTSSQTESTEIKVPAAATEISSVKETSIDSEKKLPAVLDKQVKTEVIDIQPALKLSPFDQQLQTAIQKLNSVRTRMFDAYSKQERFRQRLLESHQPYSTAWININQTDMVLDFISNNVAYSQHTVFVKPYIEHRLPMAEMIRSIQAERFHMHFDERNCQAYLGSASNWLDTLSPHFDYLDKLMSVTESLLANQQRVA